MESKAHEISPLKGEMFSHNVKRKLGTFSRKEFCVFPKRRLMYCFEIRKLGITDKRKLATSRDSEACVFTTSAFFKFFRWKGLCIYNKRMLGTLSK